VRLSRGAEEVRSVRIDKELLSYPKVDVHTHIGIGSAPVEPGYAERYLEDSRRVGIGKIMISRPFTGSASTVAGPEEIMRANDMVMELVARHPGVVYGYAYLHPGHVEWCGRELARCMACRGMVGIKLYNQYLYDDPVVIELVRAASLRGAVVLLHQGKSIETSVRTQQPLISDGTHIARLAAAVPQAKLICGHIGGGGDWEWCAKALAGSPSVFVDTSGSVVDAGMIELASREVGTSRLLFATDMSVDQGIGKMLGAKIPDQDKRAIFSGNAARLFGEVLS
jgi:predicted TIM-barrel fold metal-dependent hydrolase